MEDARQARCRSTHAPRRAARAANRPWLGHSNERVPSPELALLVAGLSARVSSESWWTIGYDSSKCFPSILQAPPRTQRRRRAALSPFSNAHPASFFMIWRRKHGQGSDGKRDFFAQRPSRHDQPSIPHDCSSHLFPLRRAAAAQPASGEKIMAPLRRRRMMLQPILMSDGRE